VKNKETNPITIEKKYLPEVFSRNSLESRVLEFSKTDRAPYNKVGYLELYKNFCLNRFRPKSKVEITDLEMQKRYKKSLAILIIGLTIILIWAVLLLGRILRLYQLETIALIILGIIISLYGLYAVVANKLQLNWQKRIILRRFFSGSIVLIIGVIFLYFGLWILLTQISYPGAMWGLGYIGSVLFMTLGTILMILGFIRSSLTAKSYLAERKKKVS
jgi:hypothetical protein